MVSKSTPVTLPALHGALWAEQKKHAEYIRVQKDGHRRKARNKGAGCLAAALRAQALTFPFYLQRAIPMLQGVGLERGQKVQSHQ
jgi:hypothetical protein